MKKTFALSLLAAIAVIGFTSCEKTPKGILEGSVYMTKDGGSGRVIRNSSTGEIAKLDFKISFTTDKDCNLSFVFPEGKTYVRYDGTYTVSEPLDDESREVVINTNITKFDITEFLGDLSPDKSRITGDLGSHPCVLYKQK